MKLNNTSIANAKKNAKITEKAQAKEEAITTRKREELRKIITDFHRLMGTPNSDKKNNLGRIIPNKNLNSELSRYKKMINEKEEAERLANEARKKAEKNEANKRAELRKRMENHKIRTGISYNLNTNSINSLKGKDLNDALKRYKELNLNNTSIANAKKNAKITEKAQAEEEAITARKREELRKIITDFHRLMGTPNSDKKNNLGRFIPNKNLNSELSRYKKMINEKKMAEANANARKKAKAQKEAEEKTRANAEEKAKATLVSRLANRKAKAEANRIAKEAENARKKAEVIVGKKRAKLIQLKTELHTLVGSNQKSRKNNLERIIPNKNLNSELSRYKKMVKNEKNKVSENQKKLGQGLANLKGLNRVNRQFFMSAVGKENVNTILNKAKKKAEANAAAANAKAQEEANAVAAAKKKAEAAANAAAKKKAEANAKRAQEEANAAAAAAKKKAEANAKRAQEEAATAKRAQEEAKKRAEAAAAAAHRGRIKGAKTKINSGQRR